MQIRFIKSKVEAVTPTPVDGGGGDVSGIDRAGVVTLADGVKLPYDWLVLSLGSDTNLGAAPAPHALLHVLAASPAPQRARPPPALRTPGARPPALFDGASGQYCVRTAALNAAAMLWWRC